MSSCLRAKNWLRFAISSPLRSADRLAIQARGQIRIGCQICKLRNRMRLAPEGCRHGERIDSLFLPPGTLIAASMELTVVQPANRDSGPVADFPPHRPLLGKLEVVRIGWR